MRRSRRTWVVVLTLASTLTGCQSSSDPLGLTCPTEARFGLDGMVDLSEPGAPTVDAAVREGLAQLIPELRDAPLAELPTGGRGRLVRGPNGAPVVSVTVEQTDDGGWVATGFTGCEQYAP